MLLRALLLQRQQQQVAVQVHHQQQHLLLLHLCRQHLLLLLLLQRRLLRRLLTHAWSCPCLHPWEHEAWARSSYIQRAQGKGGDVQHVEKVLARVRTAVQYRHRLLVI